MEVRPIDAEKYMELLKEQYLHHKSMGNNQAAKAWQGAMQLLYDMPTLAPPNEPLTLEELREMEQSTPVWWDYIPCWVLVRRGSVLVFGSEPHKVENLFGYFYRRPPEGEGDGAK